MRIGTRFWSALLTFTWQNRCAFSRSVYLSRSLISDWDNKNRFPIAELGNRFFYLMAGADSCHRRRYAVNYPQYVQDCSRWIQSLFFHKIINICLPLADIIRNQNVSDFGLDVLALHGSSSHVSSRFPDSPIFTLSYLLTKMGMQWFFKTVLLAYSGRTVQVLHLIPFHPILIGTCYSNM